MSYCRWSSDNFKSDVYVYESCHGGFDIHIASNRIVSELPEPPSINLEAEEFEKQHKAHHLALEQAERENIDLPHAGESLNEATAGETAARLLQLRYYGYYVPQYAIDALMAEHEEDTAA